MIKKFYLYILILHLSSFNTAYTSHGTEENVKGQSSCPSAVIRPPAILEYDPVGDTYFSGQDSLNGKLQESIFSAQEEKKEARKAFLKSIQRTKSSSFSDESPEYIEEKFKNLIDSIEEIENNLYLILSLMENPPDTPSQFLNSSQHTVQPFVSTGKKLEYLLTKTEAIQMTIDILHKKAAMRSDIKQESTFSNTPDRNSLDSFHQEVFQQKTVIAVMSEAFGSLLTPDLKEKYDKLESEIYDLIVKYEKQIG